MLYGIKDPRKCAQPLAPLWLPGWAECEGWCKAAAEMQVQDWELKLSLGETIINILQEHLPTVKP